MKGSTLSGTLECWRGTGEWDNYNNRPDEAPVEVAVSLHVWPVPPEEGGGYEVDLLEAVAAGQPFALTDDEVERALEQFAREEA